MYLLEQPQVNFHGRMELQKDNAILGNMINKLLIDNGVIVAWAVSAKRPYIIIMV